MNAIMRGENNTSEVKTTKRASRNGEVLCFNSTGFRTQRLTSKKSRDKVADIIQFNSSSRPFDSIERISSDITGCSRKVNPQRNRTSIKDLTAFNP